MNRLIRDPRIRRFMTVEWALVVVALVLAYYTYNTYQSSLELADERVNFERRLTSARADLVSLRSGVTEARLQSELETIVATAPPEFPPLLNALDFGTELTEYTSFMNLDLKSLDVSSTVYEAAGDARPAISYSLSVQGSITALIGVLSVPEKFPTAVIRDLSLASDPDDPGVWEMKLVLFVVHSGA